MKKTRVLFLLLVIYSAAYGDGTGADREPVKTPETEKTKSITDEWKETLMYGIADQVISTLKDIRAAKETSLNTELTSLFIESINDKLRYEILDYFQEIKYKGLESTALALLEEYESNPKNLVLKSIKYLAAIESPGLIKLINSLLDATDNDIAIAAIQASGDLNNRDNIDVLLEKLDDDEYSNKRKPEILLTLGKIKAVKAVPKLIEIIEDKEEDKIWRMYASDSLGKIGDKEAVAPLKKLFNEDDALIRAYAATALSHFKLPEVTDILIQGLKDTNWKVRVQAARGLADKSAGAAFNILKYKVEKDPVNDVRYESIRSIGAIGNAECFDYLKSLYLDDGQSSNIRDLCLEMLLKYDLEGSLGTIKKIVERDLQKEKGKSAVIELTGKRLFTVESPGLLEIFRLFLTSRNMLLRIYGIRGAVINHFTGLKEKITEISEKDPVPNVKQEALSALAKF